MSERKAKQERRDARRAGLETRDDGSVKRLVLPPEVGSVLDPNLQVSSVKRRGPNTLLLWPCGITIEVGGDGRVIRVGAPRDSELARSCAGFGERADALEEKLSVFREEIEQEHIRLRNRQDEAAGARAAILLRLGQITRDLRGIVGVLAEAGACTLGTADASVALVQRVLRSVIGVVSDLSGPQLDGDADVVSDEVPEQDDV
jgi:hypothetical protein